MASAYLNEGQSKDAIKYFKKLLKSDDQDLLAHLNLGIAYFIQNDIKQMDKYFEKAIHLNALSTLSFFITGQDIESYKKFAPLAKSLFPDDKKLTDWMTQIDEMLPY